jgi:D-aminopeptidase
MGTSSRVFDIDGENYTVGVLVQANYGDKKNLRISGLPIGEMLSAENTALNAYNPLNGDGSIIIIVATDAPLLPHQLKRVAKRASLGLARVGSIARNGSGDIFIAFSTANLINSSKKISQGIFMLQNDHINPVFQATVEATEEAIINALIAGEDMKGHLGRFVGAIDHQVLKDILRRHNRLSK